MSAPTRSPFADHLPEVDEDNFLLLTIIEELIKRRLPFVTNDGKFNFSSTATTGKVPTGRGGTGNQQGEAIPKDNSVTNDKIPVGANIDPAKLDQALLLALIYALVEDFLVAGANVTITPDGVGHTLTIAADPGIEGITIRNATGSVAIAGATELRFGAGTVGPDGPDGAIYHPPLIVNDDDELEYLTELLDENDDPILDENDNPIMVYTVYPLPSGGGIQKYATDVGNGVDTVVVVNHALGTADVQVQVRRVASPFEVVYPDMAITDANNVTLTFAVAPTAAQYRVVVLG
jgi:hypothetical protein